MSVWFTREFIWLSGSHGKGVRYNVNPITTDLFSRLFNFISPLNLLSKLGSTVNKLLTNQFDGLVKQIN